MEFEFFLDAWQWWCNERGTVVMLCDGSLYDSFRARMKKNGLRGWTLMAGV